MFTYISIEEFADGVVKNNKDANRRELIAALRESLAAKKNGAYGAFRGDGKRGLLEHRHR